MALLRRSISHVLPRSLNLCVCVCVCIQLDARVSELTRDKSDLESRVEEDQDEIEELLGKQRSHISQVSGIQAQLTEAHTQVEELQEAKQQLETKVRRRRLERGVHETLVGVMGTAALWRGEQSRWEDIDG